jgi:aspartyl protease family protein
MKQDDHPSPWGRPNQGKPPPSQPPIRRFVIGAIAVAIFIFFIVWILSNDALSQISGASLIYDILLLGLVGAGLIGHVISEPGQALRNIAGWIIICGIIAIGYSLWNGTGRLASEFNPSKGNVEGDAISFRADMIGHYMITAKVNGRDIDFMVDTGASHVVLSVKDALKVGYNVNQLSFNLPISTANGNAFAAPVKINVIEVGPSDLKVLMVRLIKPIWVSPYWV